MKLLTLSLLPVRSRKDFQHGRRHFCGRERVRTEARVRLQHRGLPAPLDARSTHHPAQLQDPEDAQGCQELRRGGLGGSTAPSCAFVQGRRRARSRRSRSRSDRSRR